MTRPTPSSLRTTFLLSATAIALIGNSLWSQELHDEGEHNHDLQHNCVPRDIIGETGFQAPQTPDFNETYPDGSRPVVPASKGVTSSAIAPAANQPIGALTG